MRHLWQRMLHKIARHLGLYGTLDSERALREKNAEISQLKQQLEQQRGFTVVHIDEARRPPAAYEPPSPTTDGKIQVQGARYRAVTRQLQAHPGTLMKHQRKMDEQKERALHDTEPTTMVPRMPRKLALVRQQSYDNFMLPNLEQVTVLRIPPLWML